MFSISGGYSPCWRIVAALSGEGDNQPFVVIVSKYGIHRPLLNGLHWKSTLAFIRHCSRVGGNDKLAIDKGGNLPEKVENHWPRGIAKGTRLTKNEGRTVGKNRNT